MTVSRLMATYALAQLCSATLSAEPSHTPANTIAPLYAALTASTPEGVRTALESATTPDWRNCSADDACETREATVQRWTGRIARVPDFRIDRRDMLATEDRVIVRSEISGTPVGPFMGVDGHGRSVPSWASTGTAGRST